MEANSRVAAMEREYQATAARLAELLEKRAIVLSLQEEIARLHQQSIALGEAMLSGEAAARFEQDYLEVTSRIRDLLEQKREAYALLPEIARLHGELIELGRSLGWQEAEPAPVPAIPPGREVTERIAKLQKQIAGMRSAAASA
jgi:multidrug efflux pump subunit AcrA (membrane-fusion protein)